MEDKLHSSRSTLTMPNDNWSFLTSGRKIKNWKGEGSQRLQQSLQNLKQHGQDPYFMKKLGDLQTDIMTHVGMNLPKSLMGQKSRSMVFNNLPVIIKIYIQYQQIRVFQPEPSSSFSKFPPIIVDNSSSARYMGQIIQANENFNRVDYAMNEGIHFDEIWHNCDKEIRKINDDLERFVRQWPPCSFIDKFKGPFFLYPWQDPVVWNIIMTIKDKERELALILSNIPHYTQLHQLRSEKLRKLTSYRIEMERLMEQLANEYRKPCFTTIVIERPRTPPKKVDPKKLISFNIFWDFILRFFANCRAKRIVYGIYNRGEPQITPRFAHAKLITQHEVDESNAVYYEYTSIFNAHHLVKDLLVDPNSILVFEVQGNVQSKPIFYRPEDFDIYSGSGIGYPLYRNRTDDDELSLDLNMKLGEEETLAWSVLDLFTQQENLITGNFKVPLYLPPADTNINLFKFPEIVQRIPLTNVFMRIESYYTTDTDKIKRGELPRIQASQSTQSINILQDKQIFCFLINFSIIFYVQWNIISNS